MSIKILLLKSNETVICDAKELISEEKLCGYLLDKPHKIETRRTVLLVEDTNSTSGDLEISMSPWIVLTSDTQVPIPTDWVVTIVEPIKTIKEMYEEKVNEQENKVSFTES